MTPQTPAQLGVTIGLIALGTILTRALPFFLFPAGRRTPGFILYLGKVLPYAVIGMLVVYCFKSVPVSESPYGLPELAASAFVILIHRLRHNLLLSIAGGTALYMVLVQTGCLENLLSFL